MERVPLEGVLFLGDLGYSVDVVKAEDLNAAVGEDLCELGELVNGKAGREGDELIVVDLTGTGAQDAAIGQVAWDKLSVL